MPPVLVIEPPRKALRWIFLPTLVMGVVLLLGGGLSLVEGLSGRGGLPVLGAAFRVLMGGGMGAVALFALTYRGRFTVDAGSQVIRIERHSAFGRRMRSHPFAEFTAVRLRRVSGRSHPERPNLVGTYWMVLLDGEQPIHLTSDRREEAERLAAQLSETMGLPVVDKPDSVALGCSPPP